MKKLHSSHGGAWLQSDNSWRFCIKGTAASVANSQDNPSIRPQEWTTISSLLKRRRYRDGTGSSVSSWHMAHTSRYKVKSGKSLKQILADIHFCTQLFSFFLMNITFITFIGTSWPAMSFWIMGLYSQTVPSATGCDEKDKGRFCLAVFKSKKTKL